MSSGRRRYHVAKRDDGWEVKAEGAKRASAVEGRKVEAVERARQIAQNQSPSQVVIHKMDGTIQTEHTYGDDPHPPKG